MNWKEQEYKWPLQFKTVGTAVAFSPHAKANLFESIRISKMLDARMVFIHVGYKTPTTEQKMEELLSEAGCDKDNYEVFWKSGDPTKAILDSCKEGNVDLLIAGALQKENLVQYFKGSIARQLCRKANISLLLLTHANVASRKCKNIVVNGLDHPKTPDTVRMSFYIANSFGSDQITIVEEVEPKKISEKGDDDISVVKAQRQMANIKRYEKSRLEKVIESIPKRDGLLVKDMCIFGKPGYTISHFAEKNRVDLLVLNSPDTKLGIFDRVFTHDLEYVLSDLPTDILIVHTTKRTNS